MENIITTFWQAVASQNAQNLQQHFDDNAIIKWHNTNEAFTVLEYVRATCEYPDNWETEINRIEQIDHKIITVVKVINLNQNYSLFAISFFEFENGKIKSLDEYWSENGDVPAWRKDLMIGKAIIKEK